jgi:hypothetical protein
MKKVVEKTFSPTYGGIELDVVAKRGERYDLALNGEIVIRDIRSDFFEKKGESNNEKC